MKKILTVSIFMITISQFVNAQLKMLPNGNVGIGTNNPNTRLHVYGGDVLVDSYCGEWGRALATQVHYENSCAYQLWNTYYNQDVFFVHGTGYLWARRGGYFGSDSTMKKNIAPISSALNTITKLNGVRFQYKDEPAKRNYSENQLDSLKRITLRESKEFRLGLLAQEVEKVLPEVVKTMPDSTKAIAYIDLIALLIEGIKEQQKQIETLQLIVSGQEKETIQMKNFYETCCAGKDFEMKQNNPPASDRMIVLDKNSIGSAKLYDNVPNPFYLSTEIKFEIPENSVSAKLIICDMQGMEIRSFPIAQKGLSMVTINGSDLKAGMYLYTLLVNNRIIETKRMILTRE